MATPNPFHHVSVDKPQQSERRSSYLHDLGNGNFLDPETAKFAPASHEPLSASVLPHREYHGILDRSTKPREARPRNYTAPAAPRPRHGPSSWPEAPTLHNDKRTQDDPTVPHASSDDDGISSQNAVEPISYPTILPLNDRDMNWSPNSMLRYPFQNSENNNVYTDEGFIPQVYPNLSTNISPHPYLSSPPFNHSFLYHPEMLYRIGFLGLYDYATIPPISEMKIKCPLLPWSIRLYQAQYITVYDVLLAIYGLLHESPTESEVNILYSSSGSKQKYRKVMKTYKKRLTDVDVYQQPGDNLRKIDWLSGKHTFVRLSKNDDGGQWRPFWTLSLHRGNE